MGYIHIIVYMYLSLHEIIRYTCKLGVLRRINGKIV